MEYDSIIGQMTIEEKISMLAGKNFWQTRDIERLGIESIMLTDGPHGLRKQGGKADHLGLNASIPSTCFPTAASVANSWDRDLIREMGKYLSVEAVKEDVSILLGPGLNIKRNPLCGRNFEYFSEDPLLSGELAGALVDGIQTYGIGACLKHYAVNSQENLRMTIDEVVDYRSLHEIYLRGFKIALSHNPMSVMTSYNKVNGVYANENSYLINDILKERFHFDGLVVTDWGGNKNRVEALKCGNQLEMPYSGGITALELLDAVNKEPELEVKIDAAVNDILKVVNKTKLAIDENKDEVLKRFNYERHHQMAVKIASESIVLLKNEDNMLPLYNGKVGIFGDFAFKPRYQGAGSSLIEPSKLPSAFEVFDNSGYDLVVSARGYNRYGQPSKRMSNKAVRLAKKCDTVIYYMGLDESSETEGLDRSSMKVNKNQTDLLKKIYSVNKNIIVVLMGGSSIEMKFEKYAKAIIHTYLGGQGVNEAILKVLTGEVNPSGRLAETYPYKWRDVLSSKNYREGQNSAIHKESIFVGYRYFETANIDVRYEFGYGLSYTTFSYANISIKGKTISLDVKNTGASFGKEVVQFYIKPVNSKIFRSSKELIGFEKIALQSGETKTVTYELTNDSFDYYSITSDQFEIEDIDYEIQVGSSIKDIKLSLVVNPKKLKFNTTGSVDYLYLEENASNYYNLTSKGITDRDFQKLVDFPLPQVMWDTTRKLTLDDAIIQTSHRNILGRSLYYLLSFTHNTLHKLNKPILANYVYFLMYMPFRQISRFSNGKIKESTIQMFLDKI